MVFGAVETAERTHFNRRVHFDDVKRSTRQLHGQLFRAGKIKSLVGLPFVVALLTVQLQSVAKAIDNSRSRACADKVDISRFKGDLARTDGDFARSLDKMQISTGQRAVQFDRRNGEIVAVYRRGKVRKACAAAV